MIGRFVGSVAVVAAVFVPVHAQGVPGGAERGARDGERAAGPVGVVVGGVIGGVVGGVTGVLGVDARPRFRSYVVEQRRPAVLALDDPAMPSSCRTPFVDPALKARTLKPRRMQAS